MKRNKEKIKIPLHSEEAARVVGNLVDKAIKIFEKEKVNVDWNKYKWRTTT